MTMANQDNTQLVQEAYATFGRGDIPALLDMMTEDIVWVSPGPRDVLPTAGERRGHDQVAQFFSTLNDTEEIQRFEPQEFIAQDDKVVALVKYGARMRVADRSPTLLR